MDFIYGGKKMELRSSRLLPNGQLHFIPATYELKYLKKQGENKMAGLEGHTITNGPLTGNWAVGVDWATTKYRQVKIAKVTNGFIVEIGCKKFVAENWKSLAFKLEEYWKDPVAAEKKYAK